MFETKSFKIIIRLFIIIYKVVLPISDTNRHTLKLHEVLDKVVDEVLHSFLL